MSTMSVAKGGGLFRHNVLVLFAAGFLSVLVFQMGFGAIMHVLGFVPNPPFGYGATKPLGVPQTWSWAFWGGIGDRVRPGGEVFPARPDVLRLRIPVRRDRPDPRPLVHRLPDQGASDGGWMERSAHAIQVLAHGCFGLGVGIFVQAFSKNARA